MTDIITSLLANSSTNVDQLSIEANGQVITGWQDISVSRSIRRFPSSFEISFTERYPQNASAVVILPGSPCTVRIGNDTVLTGFVDRYAADVGPTTHNVHILGRSKCEDLFDCGTANPIKQAQSSVLDYATQLCQPFDITVTKPGKGNGLTYPYYAGNMTESPYRLIETIARYSALLVYDDTSGNLVLNDVGAGKMSSGFTQGQNIQTASVSFSMDHRYKDYYVIINAVGQRLQQVGASNEQGHAVDDQVKRYRPIFITGQQILTGSNIAQTRATWERNRRFGESAEVHLICDSWRDTNGMLWQPNYYAPLSAAAIKIDPPTTDWVIADVTYKRNLQLGTVSEITMMSAGAFSLQPLSPVGLSAGQTINQGNK